MTTRALTESAEIRSAVLNKLPAPHDGPRNSWNAVGICTVSPYPNQGVLKLSEGTSLLRILAGLINRLDSV